MTHATTIQAPARAALAQSLLAVSGFLLLSLVHRSVEPSASSGDWAQYILHAKALLEGRPYTDTGYLFTRLNWSIGPRAYPPGLPLTLVPLAAMGPWAPVLMRLLMVASGALFVLFAYRRLRLDLNPWLAAGAAMWCGVVIELAFASVSVLSDLGFCLLCWVVIYQMDRPGEWSKSRITVAAIAGLAAMSYRVAGIALLGAVGVFLALNRGGAARAARVLLGVWSAVLLGALLAAPALLPRQLLTPSIGDLLTRAVGNLRAFRLTLFEAQLYPANANLLNDAYHVVASLLFAIGVIVLVRRAWRSFMVVFAAVYGVMLFVAPVNDGRYFWPLFPLVSAGLLQGAVTAIAAGRWFIPQSRAVPVTVVTSLTLLALAVGQSWRIQPALGFSDFPAAVALSDFLKERALRGESRRVAFINPRVLTLRTGVPAMGLVPARPSAVVREFTRLGITHVVFGAFTSANCQTLSLLQVRSAYPEAFEPERTFGGFSLERFTPPDSATLANPRVADQAPSLCYPL